MFEMNKETGLFIGKCVGVAIVGLILNALAVDNPPSPFLNCDLGNFILTIILITGWVKLAMVKKEGWLWISTFLYFSCFKHPGLTAWIYLAMSGGCIYTYFLWKKSLIKGLE
jgi:hypothetical protein